ncbi:MAG: ATP-binding protein [Bacteroidota bacterium]
MERKALQKLAEWKIKNGRKPIIIQGARQVGKTWLMKEFVKKAFKKTVYINFESSKRLQNIFESDFNIERIISIFEVEFETKIDNNTLIILDEIQEAKKGITALKYFFEKSPQYFIVAAGSYLGVSLQKNNSFPVGKVDLMTLYPLTFEEFISNSQEKLLAKHRQEKNWKVLSPFHDKLVDLLRTYYFIGGMPEAVNSFFEKRDLHLVREIQKNILSGYENDFAKHAPIEIVPKIKMVWNSIISQLSKENKKFMYGDLKKGGRAKEFETAINWLENSGLIYKSHRVSKPGIPLKSYADSDVFKLFLLDTGLLNAMADVDEKILLQKNKILTEFKGAMTEQFVAQELRIKQELFYWTNEKSVAEIDFLVQKKNTIIPVEAKAEENLKAKSLKVYKDKFHPENAIRTSMNFYRKEKQLTNVPLYSIGILE